jgi:hypothetical protein
MCGKIQNVPKECSHSVSGWLIQSVLCDVPSKVTIVYQASKTQNAREHFSHIVPVRFEFYWLGKLWLLCWGHHKEHSE